MSTPIDAAPRQPLPAVIQQDVRLLISAQSVSTFGSFITRAALPLLAIIGLKIGAAEAALLAAADLVASALISQFAGVWIDRLPRRPVLIGADLIRAALLASIPLTAALTGSVSLLHLVIASSLSGATTTAFDIAERSYLAGLVPTPTLRAVLARMLAIRGAAEFFGFGAAGILITHLGGPAAIGIDAATYLVSALFLTALRAPEPALPPVATRQPVAAEMRDGLRRTWAIPILRPLLGSGFIVGIYFGLFRSSYLLFVVNGLHLQPDAVGGVIASGGIAALLGGVLTEPFSRALGVGRSVVIGLIFVGFGLVLVPLAALLPAISLLLLVAHQFLSDGFETVWEANQGAIRARVVAAEYQGRANAAFDGLGILGRLCGICIGGFIGSSAAGSGAALLAGGAAAMLVGLFVATTRLGAIRSVSDLPAATPRA